MNRIILFISRGSQHTYYHFITFHFLFLFLLKITENNPHIQEYNDKNERFVIVGIWCYIEGMKETLHILVRVSTRIQIEGYSLDIQKKQGIEYSKRLGMNHKIYEEGGVSGTLPIEDRPELLI